MGIQNFGGVLDTSVTYAYPAESRRSWLIAGHTVLQKWGRQLLDRATIRKFDNAFSSSISGVATLPVYIKKARLPRRAFLICSQRIAQIPHPVTSLRKKYPNFLSDLF